MRGKGYAEIVQHAEDRITPAHAGKSGEAYRENFWEEDHPRPCGEKEVLSYPRRCRLGSPPPMRRKGVYE